MARIHEHPPDNLYIKLHKGFQKLQKKKKRLKMARELKFDSDTELVQRFFETADDHHQFCVVEPQAPGKHISSLSYF